MRVFIYLRGVEIWDSGERQVESPIGFWEIGGLERSGELAIWERVLPGDLPDPMEPISPESQCFAEGPPCVEGSECEQGACSRPR